MEGFFKKYFKFWFRNIIALMALASWYAGFVMETGFENALITAFVLSTIQIFLEPLLKMLILPINIITLGMFTWLLDAVVLVLLSYAVEGVQFTAFSYERFSVLGIPVAGGSVNIIFSVIVGSILYKIIHTVISNLTN